MFNVTIMETDAFVCKGLTDYFGAPAIRMTVGKNLSALRTELEQGIFDVVIMELMTHDDSLHDCVEFARQFPLSYPDVKLIIYTRFTDKVIMQFIAHHISKGYVILKQDSLQLLSSCIFTNEAYSIFHSSADINVLRYLSADSTLITITEWNVMGCLMAGFPLSAISQRYNLSVRAIRQHIRSLMVKMMCKNKIYFYLKLSYFRVIFLHEKIEF